MPFLRSHVFHGKSVRDTSQNILPDRDSSQAGNLTRQNQSLIIAPFPETVLRHRHRHQKIRPRTPPHRYLRGYFLRRVLPRHVLPRHVLPRSAFPVRGHPGKTLPIYSAPRPCRELRQFFRHTPAEVSSVLLPPLIFKAKKTARHAVISENRAAPLIYMRMHAAVMAQMHRYRQRRTQGLAAAAADRPFRPLQEFLALRTNQRSCRIHRPVAHRTPSGINEFPDSVENPGSKPDSSPGRTPGRRPGRTPGNRPGRNPGSRPGRNPGSRPGNTGIHPGSSP